MIADCADQEKKEKIERIALHIWKLSKDQILVNLRFLNMALSSLSFQAKGGLQGISCDGSVIYYDPIYVIQQFKKEPTVVTRSYLHMILHCIFQHAYRYEKVEQDLWNVACDIAIECVIFELDLAVLRTSRDEERKALCALWKKRVGSLTAEKIYRWLQEHPMEYDELASMARLVYRDDHEVWKQAESLEISQAQWQKISERIKAELKSFSQDRTEKNQSIVQNLEEATREHYDYGAFLKRFCVSGEDMQINDDEFDYVYYTYGLQVYGNMPLVEPLEYKDVNKIKEFVVAIDTSASCRGEIVQAFLQKTYDILKSSENFFRKVNIHIIQCDSQVQSDTKITCDEDFEAFMKFGKLEGFGSTDFRPVFTYVNECIEKKEFENLKGLIYFTDGYGIFPEHMPAYDTAFVFLEDDYQQPQIPPWAIKLVLSRDEI